jgi:Caudovirus prohead serine protease
MEAKAKPDLSGVAFGGSLMHSDDNPTPDFSGYVTKYGLKCSDGRTILAPAFKHQDNMTIPLVWQHNHDEPSNILGHMKLEHRDDGVYAYAFFNESDQAKNAKLLVQHKDIKSLSIYANQLTEKAKQVLHGVIREASLVLSGANPGALIDNITLAHNDGGMVTLEDEAIIYTGLELEHAGGSSSSSSDSTSSDSSTDGPTVQDVYDSMTDEQKEVVHYFVGAALEEANQSLSQSGTTDDNNSNDSDSSDEDNKDTSKETQQTAVTHSDGSGSATGNDNSEGEGRRMTRNVFDQQNQDKEGEKPPALTHDAIKGIVADARQRGSLKEAVDVYALKHGIENIDLLFPDAKALTSTPEFDSRRVEWVRNVIDATRKTPFSRIKSLVADITFDEARARGYVKGNLKSEEWFGISKRVTTPATVYKKQKLDRDDVIDITDFDVVVWLKAEMRLMLDEELARAILIGDGRNVSDPDKIKDPQAAAEGSGIRSIANDHELYVARVNVNVEDANSSPLEMVDSIVTNMRFYKGSGSPTFYTTLTRLNYMLLARDTTDRRLWRNPAELASELGVKEIVTIEAMESVPDLVGIAVNMVDYTLGADRGGELNFFDDFDIDYNQYTYLYETRLSGALTKIRSAVVFHAQLSTDTLVEPNAPTFDPATGNITIVDTANVVYKRSDTNATVTAAGSPYNIAAGVDLTIYAVPGAGHYVANNVEDSWTFHRPH